jgi:Tol biopolymer transport system component
LLASSLLDTSAAFSPDGTRIAFISQRGGATREVWLANADGTGQTPLTVGPGTYQGSPAWAPDGKWLAFDSQSSDAATWQIWVVESSGGGTARRITNLPQGAIVPSWSSDGQSIYFSSVAHREIFRIPVTGGAPEQVTRAGGVVAQPSPDGKTLYYTKVAIPSSPSALYAMPIGGGPERVVAEGVLNRAFRVFGDGVYFLGRPGGKYEIRFHEFTSGKTRTVGAVEGVVHTYLSVSPDRKTILFTYSPRRGSDLMLIENFR